MEIIEHRVSEFFVMLRMLEVGGVGVFLSLDLSSSLLFGNDADSDGVFLMGYLGPRCAACTLPKVRARQTPWRAQSSCW